MLRVSYLNLTLVLLPIMYLPLSFPAFAAAFEKVGRDAAEVRAAQYPEFSGHSARNVHIREAPSESKGKGCCRS